MIGARLRQFREYNGFPADAVSSMLGISCEKYISMEEGKTEPDIDILSQLSAYYRVTIDELYGYTPRLRLNDSAVTPDSDVVDDRLLKMSDLTWDEAQIILYYRSLKDTNVYKDDIISEIIKRGQEEI